MAQTLLIGEDMLGPGADERRAAGKALREMAPRAAHAEWKAPLDRRNPIELLHESNAGRIPALIPIRYGRMMPSPFTFFRGAACIMAADLATTPTSGLRVQACGDAHLLNFGGFATPERNINFDINDLDETLPAPWEWDVKRLVASVVIAGQYLGLSRSAYAGAAVATVRSYRDHMTKYVSMPPLTVWHDVIRAEDVLKAVAESDRGQLRQRVERAEQRSSPEFVFPRLAKQRATAPKIKDDPPLIFHPSAKLAPGHATSFREQVELYRASLSDHVRVLLDRYRLCDVAIKVVGVGSVGTVCGLGLFMTADKDALFLQIKQAKPSVLEPYAGKSIYENSGQRVVNGQHLMQSASDIFLGWFTSPNGAQYYVRQLRDAKISAIIEDFDAAKLRSYAQLCGWALAKAHARSGDPAKISGYIGASSAIDDAICEFAVGYADQNQRDYRAFVKAVRAGHIKATIER
jgi:uncharacterized protein (DUF2252 family)